MRPAAVILVGGLCLGSGYLLGVWRRAGSAPRSAVIDTAARRASVTAPVVAAPVEAEAFARGRALVDAALARGVWTEGDRAQLGQLLPTLTRAHADALAGRLTAALDEGHVRVTFAGAPL